MDEQKNFYDIVEEICQKDSRYKPDAYEFVMQALHYTQKKLNRQTHVSGKELLEGIRELAIEQYGVMVKTVLAHWGIRETEDFGTIVFIMVEKKILSKTDTDLLDDFKAGYDFKEAFGNILASSMIEELENKT